MIWSLIFQGVFCRECKEPYQKGHKCTTRQAPTAEASRQSVRYFNLLILKKRVSKTVVAPLWTVVALALNGHCQGPRKFLSWAANVHETNIWNGDRSIFYRLWQPCLNSIYNKLFSNRLQNYQVSADSARRACWEQQNQQAQNLIREISKECPNCKVPTEKSGWWFGFFVLIFCCCSVIRYILFNLLSSSCHLKTDFDETAAILEHLCTKPFCAKWRPFLLTRDIF